MERVYGLNHPSLREVVKEDKRTWRGEREEGRKKKKGKEGVVKIGRAHV